MSERENTLFKACFPFIIIKKEVLGMPNYVKSKITGITKEQLMPYLSDDGSGEEYLDFEKIIPMPKELRIESGSRLHRGMEIIKDNVLSVDFINNLSDEEKDYINMGFKGLYNKLHYGFQDWYDWRWANWGTKCNSCGSEFQDNAIFISTAWSMPFPVIKKLSELLKSEITIIYADEDFGCNTGRFVFKNGDVLEEYNPAICSGDAFVCVYEARDYEYEINKHENGEHLICFEGENYIIEQFTEKLS